MRRAARTDSNQEEIVSHLRAIGASVQILAEVGHGCPDLLIGWRGKNLLAEVKRPGGRMTGDELDWHGLWRGQVAIIRSVHEADLLLQKGCALT